MQGNLHVPFLGGWAGAIPPGYPADEETYRKATRLVPTQHVPFLGGWAGAIPPGYPADEETYRKATRLVPTQRKEAPDRPCLRCQLVNLKQ